MSYISEFTYGDQLQMSILGQHYPIYVQQMLLGSQNEIKKQLQKQFQCRQVKITNLCNHLLMSIPYSNHQHM